MSVNSLFSCQRPRGAVIFPFYHRDVKQCKQMGLETRTGFPAGSLNLFSLPWSVSVQHILFLHAPPLSAGTWTCCLWSDVCSFMHIWVSPWWFRYITTAGSGCKSRIDMECELFMLQLTADLSILEKKMLGKPRKWPSAITFDYYSIRGKHLSKPAELCSVCGLAQLSELKQKCSCHEDKPPFQSVLISQRKGLKWQQLSWLARLPHSHAHRGADTCSRALGPV